MIKKSDYKKYSISQKSSLVVTKNMEYFWICLVALLGLAWGEKSCPPPKDLLPCSCDLEGVNCMGAKNLDDIKRAFRVKFPYGATRAVWVQGTPITSLPDSLFGNIKSQKFYVEVNNLTSVDLNAFKGSKTTLMALSMYGNKIKDFPFTDLSMFETLSTLNLGRNKIERVPDNAFNSRSLFSIILAQNQIKYIGANAFANLPSLRSLEMSLNQIVTLGPMSMAMKQHGGQLQIHLSNNKISNISSTAFQGVDPLAIFFSQNKLTTLKKDVFEPLAIKAGQKGGYIEVTSNPLSCKGCDYSWIAVNKNALASKLVGFACHDDGTTILDLTKEKIGCH